MSADELRRSAKSAPASDFSLLSVAHQFNNLLMVIQGNIALVQMTLRSSDPSLSYLSDAADACDRAASITAQMLAVERSGEMRRKKSIAAFVKEAVERVRLETGIAADLHLSPDLWTTSVDPAQIDLALYEILLENGAGG